MSIDGDLLGQGTFGHRGSLSFELTAFGRPLILRPSGLGGADSLHRVAGYAQARLRQRVAHRRFHFVCASRPSAEYGARHTRHVACAFGEYWVIADRLQAETERCYDFRLPLSEHAQGVTHIHRITGGAQVRAPNLLCVFDSAATHELALDAGFTVHRDGGERPAPVVRATQYARNTWFHAVIVPHAGAAPSLSARVLSDLRSTHLLLEISSPGCNYRDVLCFGQYQGALPSGARAQVTEGCAAVRHHDAGDDEWHASADVRFQGPIEAVASRAGVR